ncbi:hypothetical protein [Pseudonocardia asaccharolytica]|uniref:hypothetical protein n=1 Tax=Pseudonocardia asaccharolytica TaxID=54010 RepID=UPI0004099BA7|nr:hypothetical protein [Pseudonocardia asaccharolytica]
MLQILETAVDETDDDVLGAADLVDSARLAEHDPRDVIERAAADCDWVYGHVVIDEAQELSAMQWRMLVRRCPSRSFTVVGDLAQRRSDAGPRAWADVLDPIAEGRWIHHRLTVNYRTPGEIMAVAAGLLRGVDPPRSVRWVGVRPWACRVPSDALAAAVMRAVQAESEREGTVAVVAPQRLAADLDAVEAPVLSPEEAKGVEFDSVLVVEPEEILRAGSADLYVALM